jgi:hypothetical protein
VVKAAANAFPVVLLLTTMFLTIHVSRAPVRRAPRLFLSAFRIPSTPSAGTIPCQLNQRGYKCTLASHAAHKHADNLLSPSFLSSGDRFLHMSTAAPEPRVVGPQIRLSVVIKFALASMLMVTTPTLIFFASHYRYLDCAQPGPSFT